MTIPRPLDLRRKGSDQKEGVQGVSDRSSEKQTADDPSCVKNHVAAGRTSNILRSARTVTLTAGFYDISVVEKRRILSTWQKLDLQQFFKGRV